MKSFWTVPVMWLLAALVAVTGCGPARPGRELDEAAQAGRAPRIYPDYSGTVIPPNIAPLNFTVQEPGTAYFARIRSESGDPIEVGGRSPDVVIPIRPWRRLLAANRGRRLYFDVWVREGNGRWTAFSPVANFIAEEDIDPYVVYRVVGPVYSRWRAIRICERNLESYRERVLLDNSKFDYGCMNCHAFASNDPQRMLLQVRSGLRDYGKGMLLELDGRIIKVDTRSASVPGVSGYPAWSPDGRAVVFSADKLLQMYHSVRPEIRDTVNLQSDVGVYLVRDARTLTAPALADPNRLETMPSWSPDGRYLYFSSAPAPWKGDPGMLPEGFQELRYDIVRVRCDFDTRTWGKPETVLSAEDVGLSCVQPRVSPEGRFVLFCGTDYGAWPIHHPATDLYVLDLKTGRHWRLACSTDQTDAWHCWSSNGRWIAFSSKKMDGLFARIYISHVDAEGRAAKAFVLPQRDPTHYGQLLCSYTLPELITGPVPTSAQKIARAIRSGAWVRTKEPATAATPRAQAGGGSPYAPPTR